MKKVDSVNYYPFNGKWCYTAWRGRKFDHENVLEAATATEAWLELEEMFPGASLKLLWDDDE
jgi:hypothetical protein